MNLYKKVSNKISSLLNTDLNLNENFDEVLNNIKTIIGCDWTAIFYINETGFEIKKSKFEENCLENFNSSLKGGGNIQEFIENKTPVLLKLDDKKDLIEEIGLNFNSDNYSAIITPLNIKSAMFGVIVSIRLNKNFTEEELDGANCLSAVCAYLIKDSELSDVFKLQVKILNQTVKEKSEAYEIIKYQKEKVQESERVKSEFIANMSHELRSPLNSILNFSEGLKLKLFGDLTQKQEEYVSNIYSSGEHLLSLINDLLDISKIEAGAMKLSKHKFDVLSSINNTLPIIKGNADEKKIEITTNFPAKDFQINADEKKFQQIIINLLSNAVKYTDEGGKVEIRTEKTKTKLRVSVQDNGIGIDPKYYGKIFGKFEQIDSSLTKKQSSTGLGLAITKELVEMHGGTIWVASKVLEGTTFTFEIPLK